MSKATFPSVLVLQPHLKTLPTLLCGVVSMTLAITAVPGSTGRGLLVRLTSQTDKQTKKANSRSENFIQNFFPVHQLNYCAETTLKLTFVGFCAKWDFISMIAIR